MTRFTAVRPLIRWFARLWDQHGPASGVRYHLRRFHYRLFTHNVPLPDGSAYTRRQDATPAERERPWTWMINASRYARYLGLVDPESMDDRRNPGLVQHVGAWDDDAAEVELEDYGWCLELEAPELPEYEIMLPETGPLPELAEDERLLRLPGVVVRGGYFYSVASQPALLEVWVEKTTMDDVVIPVARELGLNVVRGAGFLSVTNMCMALRRAEAIDRDIHIFYVSDNDPSGEAMPRQCSRQLEFWRERLGVARHVSVTPVALTDEQVQHYDLPQAPDSGNVELDALEAIHPGTLADLIRAAVTEWRDSSPEDRYEDAARQAQAAADEQWRDACEAARQVVGEVIDGYRAVLEEWRPVAEEHRQAAADLIEPLRDAVRRAEQEIADLARTYADRESGAEAKIDALNNRLESEVGDISELFDATEFRLPDCPEGEIEPDRDLPLFDSRRPWLEQLNRYRADKGLASLQVTGSVGAPGRVPVGRNDTRIRLRAGGSHRAAQAGFMAVAGDCRRDRPLQRRGPEDLPEGDGPVTAGMPYSRNPCRPSRSASDQARSETRAVSAAFAEWNMTRRPPRAPDHASEYDRVLRAA